MTAPPAHPQAGSHPQAAPASQVAEPSPLDQIVDDYEPRLEAFDLAVAALQTGSTFEEVKSRLMEIGWSESDAQEILEEARIHTREARGLITRDQVLRNVHGRYRQGMSGWFVGFPLWAAAFRFIHARVRLAILLRTH